VKAFTLVELLVVLTIAGMLAVLGLPGIDNVIQSSKRAKEISALKGLTVAYNLYAADNSGQLLKSYDMNGTAIDMSGRTLEGEDSHEAHRWPWRLAPYFNYGFYTTTHVNAMETYIKNKGGLSQTYLVSVIPSFGLSISCGGNDYEGSKYKVSPASNIVQVTKPSQFISFVSSRSAAINEKFEGFYYVAKPVMSVWDSKSAPKSTGYISARYNKQAVVAFLGGNVSVMNFSELTNSMYWDK
jgi:prepilin-type N-terminal cleavage/methylation domain-containing protein